MRACVWARERLRVRAGTNIRMYDFTIIGLSNMKTEVRKRSEEESTGWMELVEKNVRNDLR